YDSTSRELKVTTTTAALANKVQGKLQLWLVEDGIVSIQQLPGNVIERNYVHNHVLRATLNGDWGEDVSINANNEKTFTHTLTLPNGVNADKAWVVAFVYNDDGVVQVDRHKVAN
ncbi:MAG: Omp28-related outer membrane protein, partial [Prevotella shahii]|nr:Omp28-related outer membrane protein [Hoylesella shahii]